MGHIKISYPLYREMRDGKKQDLCKLLFSKFFPFFMDHDLYRNIVTYYGTCEEFREIKEGEIDPLYEVVVHEVKGKPNKIEFEEYK